MTKAVMRHFPEGTRVSQPEGGFVIWVELPGDVDSFDLARRALAAGVSIAPVALFSARQKYRNCIRLSCACEGSNRVEQTLVSIVRLLE